METNCQTSERTFVLTDGSARLTLGWQSAAELPDCQDVGLVAARKCDAGYEYARAHATCSSCWSRVDASPKGPAEGRSPIRKMKKVDLKGAVVVEADCADIADALLDCEALEILELTGNVSIDEGNGLYMVCPSCGSVFPVTMADNGDCHIIIRNKEGEVEIEDSFGRKMEFSRDGGLGIWLDVDKDDPCAQLRSMSALKTAVLGVSSEARRYLDISLGLVPGRPVIPDGIELLSVGLRSRFRRLYDSRFVQDVKDVVAMVDPREGSTLDPGSELFRLPRDFDGGMMPEILAKNRWPDTPEVRKAVGNRLAIAVLMSYDGAGRICGGDPEVVCRLLGSFAIGAEFAYALHDKRRLLSRGVNELLLAAAREEDPGALVGALVKMGADAISRSLDEFCALRLGKLEAYAAYRAARRDHSLEEVLASPGLLGRYESREASFRIRYTEPELALAAEVGGYRFSLPKTTGAIAAVARELGDEIMEYCGVQAAFGEKAVVIVASRTKLVAAMRVDWGRKSVDWVTYRAGHAHRGGKLGRAIGAWAEDKGLSRSKDRFEGGEWL